MIARPQPRPPVAPPNPKTVRLAKGRHRRPHDGACAMELASMLAGEPFSDSPDCVCPALAAFVRGYNDHLPDHLRQDLLACAADLVGSGHRDWAVADDRGRRLIEWARVLHAGRRRKPRFPYPTIRLNCEAAGAWAAKATRRDRLAHEDTLRLIGALAAEDPPAPAQLARPNPTLCSARSVRT